jgi:O-acetyl-ADP-ribose deacetylase (regulator of RNase III)
MLIVHIGDLLRSDCDIIAHQANCEKVMGKGIAESIQYEFPKAYEADLNDTRPLNERFGDLTYGVQKDKNKIIFNLYAQKKRGKASSPDEQKVRYNAFLKSCTKMLTIIHQFEKKSNHHFKLGLPYLVGCGLAGGDWLIIEPLLLDLSERFKKDIHLYKKPK